MKKAPRGRVGKVTACLIVKNEEELLERCLLSFKGFVDDIVIVDTGSADKTKAIAKQFTHRVYDFAWRDDFAAARNFAQAHVTTEWVLTLDADDLVENPHKIKPLIELATQEGFHGLYSTYKQDANSSQKRLSLYRKAWLTWRGVVHESLQAVDNAKIRTSLSSLTIIHAKPERRIKSDALKYLAILEAKDPGNHFGIAESLKIAGRYEEAASRYMEAYFYPEANKSTQYNSLCSAALMYYTICINTKQPKQEMVDLIQKLAVLAGKLEPKRAEAYTILGFLAEQTSRPDLAIKAYEQALICEPPEDEMGLVWLKYYKEIPQANLKELLKDAKS